MKDPKERTKEEAKIDKPKAVEAVDYPVVACPNCRDTNTFVLPPENQPAKATAEGWRKRACRACRMKFKEALRR